MAPQLRWAQKYAPEAHHLHQEALKCASAAPRLHRDALRSARMAPQQHGEAHQCVSLLAPRWHREAKQLLKLTLKMNSHYFQGIIICLSY